MVTDDVASPARGWRSIGRPGTGAADRNPYGWGPAAVLILAGLVDRVEFSLVAAVLPQLQREWGFSDTVAGSIPTAAAVTTLVLAVPAGYLADRYDRSRLITVVVVLWALTTLATAFATGFAMFYLIRVLLASAEAIDNPASASLLADWYPPRSRATVFGWWRTCAYLGGVGLVIGGILAEILGWRGMFAVMAVPALAVAVLCSRLREPERGLVDRTAAGDLGPAGSREQRDLRTQLRDVLRIRTLWFTGGALTVMSFAIGAIVFWVPSLLQRRFELGEAAAGTLSGGLTLFGIIGGTLAGARLARRHGRRDPNAWAVLVGGAGILIGAVMMGLTLATSSWVPFIALLVLFAFFSAWALPTLTACVADVIPARDRGAGFGALQVAATVGAAAGPLVVGAVSDSSGSLLTGLVPLVPVLALGGLLALAARSCAGPDALACLEVARQDGA